MKIKVLLEFIPKQINLSLRHLFLDQVILTFHVSSIGCPLKLLKNTSSLQQQIHSSKFSKIEITIDRPYNPTTKDRVLAPPPKASDKAIR